MKKKNAYQWIWRAFALLTAFQAISSGVSGQCTMPPGKPGTIMGTYKACANETIDYVIFAVPTTDTYTWTLPAGVTINGMNPYTTTDTAVTIVYGPTFTPPGTIDLVATNACGNSPVRSKNIIAYTPGSPGYITGDATACDGDTVPYSVVPFQSNTYTWSVPSSMAIVSGQGTNSVLITFNAGFTTNGTITVTQTNGCGNTGSASSKKIFKSNPPSLPSQIYGPAVACPMDTKTYSVDSLAGGTCNWTVPAGCTLTGQGDTTVQVTFPAGFTQGTLLCQYINNCGNSSNQSLQIRATPTIPGLISGPASGICNTTQTYSVAPLLGSPVYTWSVPAGAMILSGQGTTSITVSFPATVNGYITVNATNACGTSADRLLAVTGDIVIATQPSNQVACQLASAVFTVTVPGGGLSYQWRFDGANISDGAKYSGTQTNTLTVMNVDSADGLHDFDVIVSSTCAPSDTSDPATLTVNMLPPVPSDITAPAYICPGDMNVPLSVLAGGYNTTGHFWSIVSDGMITGGQGTNAVTADFFPTVYSGYTIVCRAENGCGQSLDSSKKWVRYSLSTPKFTGPTKVCQGQTGAMYTSAGVGGAQSYSWTVTPGITIVSGQGTLNLEVDFDMAFTTGQVCMTATNPCFTTPSWCKTITWDEPPTPKPISGDAYGACNTTLPYSVPAVAGAVSYDWTTPPGATISSGAGTNAVMIDFSGSINGQVCVAAVNGCTTGPYRCLTVKSVPDKPAAITPSTGTFCANQTGVMFTCSTVPGAANYLWTVPSGAVIVSGNGTTTITVDLGTSGGQVGVKAENACGKSGTRTFALAITCRETEIGGTASPFTVEALPNPVGDDLLVRIDGSSGGLVELVLTDLAGKEVLRLNQPVGTGGGEWHYSLHGMPAGAYLLTATDGSRNARIRLMKQ